MRPDLIIFDMDGTLVDSEVISKRAFEYTLNGLGLEYDDEFLEGFLGGNLKSAKEKLNERYGDNELTELILESKGLVYRRIIKDEGVDLKPGVLELLEFLKEKKYIMAVGTSCNRESAIEKLTNTGIIDYFDYIVAGDDVENGKPSPDIFLKIAEHFNVKPENCMVFEDSRLGIRAAKNAGMMPMLVPDTLNPTNDMLLNAFKILKRIDSAIKILD